ncbi:nicotinate-nucleotide diphosphorylase (carboxylating) [Kyrpidia spormannii]|uniref:Probable nicotinate-nucleotide pyrophosphorylase [carboxylating] n=1 Tax=Kyrpidia spormannii TaxID=2055160 RepID=A0A2K8N245_9BACL|nr:MULTISPECIES: carboxylating nicotinate-nucleotide diphosphorylase [Kyrpidia]ATY83651.1 nicotinate-nucleotide diphosphorylase (carboxylating) [Kyrpidia spormannii]MCL6576395.1 carboxylating nicotinate-nucleotide diphosphorylase [Kyrpidia sp.]
MELDKEEILEVVKRALREDVGHGDVTTRHVVPAGARARGTFRAKSSGVIAGLPVARQVFEILDPEVTFQESLREGESVGPGQIVAVVEGRASSILTGERVALNFLQRLSGIATKTAKFVESVRYYHARITDTRKTTPGLRALEKYAVRVGGGYNHRFGLFDAVLIKDNHIAVAGGVKQAIMAVRRGAPHTMKIEVEVETFEQIDEALEVKADIIMLDNMTVEQMKEAVERINGRAVVEASGGVTEENVVDIAKTGVDYISVGALTHSSTALDISLDLDLVPSEAEEGQSSASE